MYLLFGTNIDMKDFIELSLINFFFSQMRLLHHILVLSVSCD